ncbi:hypothetical protein [Exiguobacterium marinum]|nr:hypothetical protein [Exiguobacterium marinum]
MNLLCVGERTHQHIVLDHSDFNISSVELLLVGVRSDMGTVGEEDSS